MSERRRAASDNMTSHDAVTNAMPATWHVPLLPCNVDDQPQQQPAGATYKLVVLHCAMYM